MKKLLTLALALMMLASLGPAARADVMWEPYDNTFYVKHQGECDYLNRGFYANGPDGFVTLWDAPGGARYTAQYENGARLWGYYQYRDWICITRWEDGGEVTGWVPLSHLLLIYDYLSFAEEYGGGFAPYNGEFADYDGPVEGIALYEYPGYGWPKYTLTGGQQDFLDAMRDTGCIAHTYTDQNGGLWGFIGYLYGYRNFWICLSNPTRDGVMNCSSEEDLVLDLIDTGKITAPRTPVPPSVSYLPYALVAGVVAVTAVLLYVFYARRRQKAE